MASKWALAIRLLYELHACPCVQAAMQYNISLSPFKPFSVPAVCGAAPPRRSNWCFMQGQLVIWRLLQVSPLSAICQRCQAGRVSAVVTGQD